MAIITKIREKAGIAAGAIAISLILFLIGSDIFSGTSRFFGGSDGNSVGEIAGQEIGVQQFQKDFENARKNQESRAGRPLSDQEVSYVRDQVWEKYVQDIAVKGEIDKLGITVGKAEQVDIIQGNNISPQVQQIPIFQNQQTKQFDKNLVVQYLQSLSKAPKEQRDEWLNFEKSLVEQQKVQKYMNLLALSAYTTTAEAKKSYEEQTAKANIRYLYVPFYSVVDSTVKVTDSQLEDYLSKHKDRYKGTDSRSFQYVTFGVLPSKNDTLAFYDNLKMMVREFAAAANDSAYAQAKTDIPTKQWVTLGEMSEQMRAVVPTAIVGAVSDKIYRDDNGYSIFKFKGTKKDTVYTMRASNILIPLTAKTDSAKAQARQQAEAILKRVQGGADFATIASQINQDNTRQTGGDLGFFKTKQMVKPFEDAVMAMNGTGIIPRVVESDYGFHIIKVTEPKSNTLYHLLTISKRIDPSTATRDEVYRKADAFLAKCKTVEDLKAEAKKNKDLIVLTAEKVAQTATSINVLSGGAAREIIRWGFSSDAEIGKVSPKAFDVDNGSGYVVAALTGKTDKDNVKVADFKDDITGRVKAELKAEIVTKKLASLSGTFEQIAQKYGAGALVESANGVTLQGTGASLPSAGPDPAVLGKAFSLKAGQKTKPFKGDAGIFIVESLGQTPAPAIADFTQYKTTGRQAAMQSLYQGITPAIKEASNIIDNRAKAY